MGTAAHSGVASAFVADGGAAFVLDAAELSAALAAAIEANALVDAAPLVPLQRLKAPARVLAGTLVPVGALHEALLGV